MRPSGRLAEITAGQAGPGQLVLDELLDGDLPVAGQGGPVELATGELDVLNDEVFAQTVDFNAEFGRLAALAPGVRVAEFHQRRAGLPGLTRQIGLVRAGGDPEAIAVGGLPVGDFHAGDGLLVFEGVDDIDSSSRAALEG